MDSAAKLRVSNELADRGFTILADVFNGRQVEALRTELAAALAANESDAVRQRAGQVYASRNILELYPPSRTVWRQPLLLDLLRSTLGPNCGLVRGLYFDKPPEKTWALPWHKDLTIAVRPATTRSDRFSTPRDRAGVPHCEAPLEILQRMLTLRIHLDDVTDENGPLQVAAGSHRTGKMMEIADCPVEPILVRGGTVLAMRPLLAHCSGLSDPKTSRHRRILHLEFSADPDLPDGYGWHEFVAVGQQQEPIFTESSQIVH